MGRQLRDPGQDREAADLADRLDAYLDERIDPDSSSAEEARSIREAYEDDPYFTGLVKRLRKKLRQIR
jgi:hypothetical protein